MKSVSLSEASLPAQIWNSAEREEQVTRFISRYLRPGDVVFSTWRKDGNADHDTVGRLRQSPKQTELPAAASVAYIGNP